MCIYYFNLWLHILCFLFCTRKLNYCFALGAFNIQLKSVSHRHLSHPQLCVASPWAWSPWRQPQREWGEQQLQVEAKEMKVKSCGRAPELSRCGTQKEPKIKTRRWGAAVRRCRWRAGRCRRHLHPARSKWREARRDQLVCRRRPLERVPHLIV